MHIEKDKNFSKQVLMFSSNNQSKEPDDESLTGWKQNITKQERVYVLGAS